MKFKIGEKVSFLNEKRQGTVVKILGGGLVSVLIEDGFEIPVMEKDLCRIDFTKEIFENPGEAAKKQEDKKQVETKAKKEDAAVKETVHSNASALYLSSKMELVPGIYLAIQPEDENNLLGGIVRIYLINHTKYDCYYTLAEPTDKGYSWFDKGELIAETKKLIDTTEASEIEIWSETQIELLFFRENSLCNKPPLTRIVRINPLRFYKEESYKPSTLLNGRALIVSITDYKKEEQELVKQKEINPTKDEAENKDFRRNIPDSEFPHRYILDRETAEIDLHIEELTDKVSGKTPTQLLDIQMNHYKKMLEKAIEYHFRKVYLIHGVGNGRLKSLIREDLQRNYPKLRFQDAPMHRYGEGATEVIIPVNL